MPRPCGQRLARRAAARRRPPPASSAPSSSPSSAVRLVGHPAEPSGSPTNPRIVPSRAWIPDRCVTTGFQYTHGGPFGAQSREGGGVVHDRRRARVGVVGPRLQRQRPLPGRGHEVERLAGPSRAEPLEPGGREHDRVHLARVQLAQPRVDVAPQLHDLEVRPHGEQLRAAAQRRGPHPRALAAARRATLGRRTSASHGHRAPPRRRAASSQPVGQLARHVLRRVHRQVDLARHQRGLDRVDPARLVADRARAGRPRW